jgi:hypothetical protein
MAALNDEEKAKVKEWLRSLGGIGDGFRCSACEVGGLIEPAVIVTLPDSGKMRVVPLTCNTCARVTLLDAERIGI